MKIHTIGFTKRTAEDFFDTLTRVGVTTLIDVRLSNSSQLAGFTKRDDLEFFVRRLCGADYLHEPLLAPSGELFDLLKKQHGEWDVFETRFRSLLAERRIEERIPTAAFAGVPVLLCSEPTADHCHRRVVAEYLAQHWPGVDVVHL